MVNLVICLILTAAFAAVFYYLPSLDLVFTNFFYNNTEGFYLQNNLAVLAIYQLPKVISALFVVGCIYYGLKILKATRSLHPKHYSKIIFVTLVCSLGPGLFVHEVLKEVYSRPRPRQVQEFGGDYQFVPTLHRASACENCYSFVSGHASAGFMVVALAILYKGRRRCILTSLSIFLGLFIGLARIIQGAHFLSDIIFAGLTVFIIAYSLELVFRKLGPKF